MDKLPAIVLFLGFPIVLFLSGCALTLPTSESIMFERPELQSSVRMDSPPIPGGSIQFSARPVLSKELPYAKEKFDDYLQEQFQEPDVITENRIHISNSNYVAFAGSFSLVKSESFGLNVSTGIPVMGIDATARLLDDTYATLNLSYLSGEFILQQKVVESSVLGISVGPFYRAEERGLMVIQGPDETFGLSTLFSSVIPAKTFYNYYIGIRSVFYRPINDRAYIYAFVSPGYVTNLNTVTVNAGIAIAF